MVNALLADFYARDINKLIEEVKLFEDEENLWKTVGSIKNSSGNLALHVIVGLNFLMGTTLAHTGYVRNRDQEFTGKAVKREWLVARLEELIPMINEAITAITQEHMEAEYPLIFDNMKVSNSYVLLQLLLHLNYHLGQVNYLRRMLE